MPGYPAVIIPGLINIVKQEAENRKIVIGIYGSFSDFTIRPVEVNR